MYFMVEELHGDWHELGGIEAEREGDAIENVCSTAGMYRARLLGTRIWRYFWVSVAGELERMDE